MTYSYTNLNSSSKPQLLILKLLSCQYVNILADVTPDQRILLNNHSYQYGKFF